MRFFSTYSILFAILLTHSASSNEYEYQLKDFIADVKHGESDQEEIRLVIKAFDKDPINKITKDAYL